jgi:hypothetical protein
MASGLFILFYALVVVGLHVPSVVHSVFCPHARFMVKHICDQCNTATRAHSYSAQVAWHSTINTVIRRKPQSWYAAWQYGAYRNTVQATGNTCVAELCISHVWECHVPGCHLLLSNVRCRIEHIVYNGHIVLDSLNSCVPIIGNDPLCPDDDDQVVTYSGFSSGWLGTSSYVTYCNIIPPFV